MSLGGNGERSAASRPGAERGDVSAPPQAASGQAGGPLHLLAPALILAASLTLPSFMLTTTRPFRGAGLGPAAWPNTMLTLVAICAAIWLLQEALAWRRARLDGGPAAAGATEEYAYGKAIVGLALVLAYGWLLPVIGFPIATTAFIAIWCVLGGIRRPVAVALVAVVGTIILLWVFMGLALMPLSRGQGVFGAISVAVLQALRIY